MTALEIYFSICLAAVRECGPEPEIAAIERIVRKRLGALPPNERQAVEAAVKALSSFEPPGFHEHGTH